MKDFEAIFAERGDRLDELDRLRTVNAALLAACQATIEEVDRNGRLSRDGLVRLRAAIDQAGGRESTTAS
jgi:hypothetical protein